jgi:eukaryotic-like serine/threonine-protein kinase
MQPNTTIGHYHIIRPLGKGGMGEVFLATDTKLKREVALKILPEAVRDDPERLRRFRVKAEAAATLNHPNIATIHSIEEADNQTFITMEHVDGKTLSEHIPTEKSMIEYFVVPNWPIHTTQL